MGQKVLTQILYWALNCTVTANAILDKRLVLKIVPRIYQPAYAKRIRILIQPD